MSEKLCIRVFTRTIEKKKHPKNFRVKYPHGIEKMVLLLN